MNRFFFNVLILFLCITNNSHPLDTLRKKYSWPESKPTVQPDWESQFCNAKPMRELLYNRPDIKLIVELGSWLGGSSRFILYWAPQATLIAIDHWQGSPEHHARDYWANKLPTLYETFLVNCWRLKDCLIPMRTTTLEGLQEIYDAGLKPDLFYVDASHDYDSVMAELEKIKALFPKAYITGDDWNWIPVRRAVIVFTTSRNLNYKRDDNFWEITGPKKMRK